MPVSDEKQIAFVLAHWPPVLPAPDEMVERGGPTGR
jgi:hypothetical protein